MSTQDSKFQESLSAGYREMKCMTDGCNLDTPNAEAILSNMVTSNDVQHQIVIIIIQKSLIPKQEKNIKMLKVFT